MSRSQRQSVQMIKISDSDLARHETLAYMDGYADARDYGKAGFFLNDEYGAYARERYLDGFSKGIRVYNVLNVSAPRNGGQ